MGNETYLLDYEIVHPDIIHSAITVRELIVALVECKHVDCDDGEGGRLAFKRLKQMHDLVNFENIRPDRHRAFFCIAFHESRWDNSEVYMIPVHQMQRFVNEFNKVSMNREDAASRFYRYRVLMKGPLLDLSLLYT
jgi:hypothetical protein